MKFDDVKECLILEADRVGLTEYEVYYMESADLSAETLGDEISTFSSGVRGGVSFRCIVDGHIGCASTELFEVDEMKRLVASAIDNAKNIESDDKAILFSGSEKYAAVNIPKTHELSALDLKNIALTMQKNTYSSSEYVIDGTQSAVFTGNTKIELMNSHGLRLSNSVSIEGAYVQSVIQKDGESQDGFDWTLSLDPESCSAVSKKATDEALSKLSAAEVESGKYDIVISGKNMRELLSAFSSSFSAKAAQLGMSRLREKENEKIAADIVTIVDDPMRPESTVQTPFDGEGVATYKKNVVENGVLKTLLYDLATADRKGTESTGNGQRHGYSSSVSIAPYSFYIQSGKSDLDELFKKAKNGIYITEFKGMHAGCNGVTGDFSIESAGYIICDGKLGEAVKSFTVAGNFFDLIQDIESLSDNVQFGIPSGFTCFGSPDALVRNMSVAGK